MASLDLQFDEHLGAAPGVAAASEMELRQMCSLGSCGSSAVLSVDESGNPAAPPGAFYVVIDEAITEIDDNGGVYTAYGFLVMWRGRQSGGYRRFHEFRAVASSLAAAPGLSHVRFPLWPFPPSSWRMSPAVIEKRARGLQGFLSAALKASATRGTLPLPLSKFLRLPAEEPEPVAAAPPLPGGASALSGGGGRDSLLDDDDADGGADVDGGPEAVPPTLQRMRRHAAALRLLRAHLERAVQPSRAAGEDAEAPYEELSSMAEQSAARLVAQLGAPLEMIDALLEKLMLQHQALGAMPGACLEPTVGGAAAPAPSAPAPPSALFYVPPALRRLVSGGAPDDEGSRPQRASISSRLRIVQTPALE